MNEDTRSPRRKFVRRESRAGLSFLILALIAPGFARAEIAAREGTPFFELKSGVTAGGASDAAQSGERFKSGATGLRWRWRDNDGKLDFRGFPFAGPQGGLSFWIHHARPGAGFLRAELLRNGAVVGAFRIRLDFSGWRPVTISFKAAGLGNGPSPDGFRLMSSASPDEVHLDCARFDLSRVGGGETDLPESLLRSADPLAAEPTRPWLETCEPATPLSAKLKADMATLDARLLPALAKPSGGLSAAELTGIRKIFASYAIRRDGDRITGRPVTGAAATEPQGGITLLEYLRFCERVARAYAHARNAGEAGELRGMYVDLCAHWLDQGWVPAGETRPFGNYPSVTLKGFAAMREVLREAGLARPMALSLAWFYGCQDPGGYLSKTPGASMDGLGFWTNELPGFLLLLPDESERATRLFIAKRAYDLMLVNPATIAPDGAVFHHGAFHFAYASYNLPRLVKTLAATHGTAFFIADAAHERLRTYARAIAFTVSGGEQPYNLAARAGAPLHADMGGFATVLAALGPPGGDAPYDREMAALALSQYVEAKAPVDKPPCSGWIADGLKPETPAGFMAINGGPVAVHRRPGWLVAIAGQSSTSRGLEIYGWTQSNNYARYARHGSICVVSEGAPPSLAASGWKTEGWDWASIPGTTAPKSDSRDLFEGYTMTSNGNPRCGGAGLEGDGVWGMDADCGGGVFFKKSVFCFDDRITVLTTDIRSVGNKPVRTTLFQNSIRPEHTRVIASGGITAELPSERLISGERDAWLLDNEGTGYLLPSGHDPVVVRCARQQWTYMIRKYLKDPKSDPFPSNDEYRRWSRRGKDMAALEAHYRPTEGDFASARFEHGANAANASCLYTMVIRATPERLDGLTRHPPVAVLRREGGWHAVRDTATGAEAYAVYAAGKNAGAGRLLAVNMPCFAMFKSRGEVLNASVASTDIHRKEPVRITLAGRWRAEEGTSHAIDARVTGDTTQISFTPDYYQAAVFRLEPLK